MTTARRKTRAWAAARALLRGERAVPWALADQALVSGGNFLAGVLLARILGISEFGVFTLVLMPVLFAGGIQHALITSPLLSIGAKRTDYDERTYLGAVLAQQGAFVGLAMAVTFVGAHAATFLGAPSAPLALPLACATGAVLMQDFVRRALFARERTSAAFGNDAVTYLGRLAVLLFAASATSLDTQDALWIFAGTAAIAAALGCVGLRRISMHSGAIAGVAVRHWQSARWLVPSTVLQWASGNMFVIAAAPMLGTAAVGAIRAAQNLFGLTHILLQGLENVLPTRTAQVLRDGGAAAVARYLKRWSRLCLVIAGAFGLLAVARAEAWLTLFYGEEFAAYGVLMRWYAVIYLLTFATFPLRIGLRAVEQTKPIFLSYVGATVFTVLSLYPLIATFALPGAMAGILGTQLVMLAVLWTAFRRQVR